MAFDYKKEYREFYLPKEMPEIVTVPPMNYIAVRGKGDPNIEDGEYRPRRRVQSSHRAAVRPALHHQDEQKGQPLHRRIF